ncbi:DNA-binding protein RFX6 [Patella vulgata]|uniref:DNA-binding protein RFX6 n=1 Tax=Patella vulgata TaxID=6465 RepID=UPI0021808620|nr:DNA-binding protein RFX6 [Patella vulgata]
MRDLTLHSASSFGSFHLLHMMLDEYTFLVLETQNELIREHTLQTNLQKHMKTTETIKMVSRVRAGSQSNSSPKVKKRKMDTRVPDDVTSSLELPKDCESHEDTGTSDHGMFIHPIPSHRDVPYCYSTNYYSPRHYQSFNNGVFERPYLPQFGVSHTYSDYINNSSSFSSQRLSSAYHQEPHSYHGHNYTSYPALARSISPVTSSYWPLTDSRPFPVPVVPESINEYSYGSGHDGYKKSSYTRSGIYPESVESSFPVSAFSSSVDSSQYVYDRPLYQDECYSTNMSLSRPGYKHYFTQNTG